MKLALIGAGSAHDGPDIDDLVALSDVITVVAIGAHVEVGAEDIEAITERSIADCAEIARLPGVRFISP